MTDELNYQNLSPVQTGGNAVPNTIAAADTISPVHRFTRIVGNTTINTIIPPVPDYHELVFVCSFNFNVFGTAGNIITAYSSVINRPITLYYNPVQQKYYVMTVG